MALIQIKTLTELAETLMDKPRRIIDELMCSMKHPERLPVYLMYFIAAKLAELGTQASSGSNYYRISPYKLEANKPVLILDLEPAGFTRKVGFWLDAATGGPVPTIRVSTNGSVAGGGGIRILPGQVNDLGEVPPTVRLYAVSSYEINGYTLERA